MKTVAPAIRPGTDLYGFYTRGSQERRSCRITGQSATGATSPTLRQLLGPKLVEAQTAIDQYASRSAKLGRQEELSPKNASFRRWKNAAMFLCRSNWPSCWKDCRQDARSKTQQYIMTKLPRERQSHEKNCLSIQPWWRCFGAIAAGLALAGDTVPIEELEIDHALTFECPTPHTDWARPYALGKTRVLFFTSGQDTAPRECVELMQRFDIDGKAAFWARTDTGGWHWHGGAIGERRILVLFRQKWDCFVFFDIPIERLPPEAQYLMLKAVAGGTGLVLVGTDDARVLKAKIV